MREIFEHLKNLSNQKLRSKLPSYKRSLFESVKASSDKIVGIYGSRGVGKTTLMLQVLKELEFSSSETIYISCDHLLFSDVSLFAFVEFFYTFGGKCVVIDEVHEAKNFEQELKSIYDFLDIKVIFSGSSAVKITNPSFVRRYAMFHLPILSLKEFCELKLKIDLPSYKLDRLLISHENIAQSLLEKLENSKILKLFDEYLEFGAYPFYFANKESYMQKLTDNINTILYADVGLIYGVSAANVELLKKLIYTISISKPLELSIESLSRTVGVSKTTLYNYIEYLDRAELLRLVVFEGKRFKQMRMPDKLYISNTNLLKTMTQNSDIGTIRETLFASQLAPRHKLHYLKQGDFLVDEKYTVEIGGKNKSFDQIRGIKNSFVVADDLEVGFGNKVPLWLFGFLE